MCGRFVQVIDVEMFIKRFGVKDPGGLRPENNYNVSAGDQAYVITNDKPDELQLFRFGLTPSWAKKQMYLINARSEGDMNKIDDLNYSGELGIKDKPSFRKPIRSQRCLVIADAFIEGTTRERLSKPYVVSKRDGSVFAFAGIWDTWVDENTGEVTNSFSIITTVANSLIQKLPHHRSPVILKKEDERKWLDTNLPLKDALNLLKPYPGKNLIANPISVQIKDPKNKNKELLIPVGDTIDSEYDAKAEENLRLEGMGSSKRKKDPPDRQGRLF
jgi:putative SOS response-associated peptidase YedK